nr:MAG TPA: hypothetical protein [Herelleviridae sp.]
MWRGIRLLAPTTTPELTTPMAKLPLMPAAI